MHSHCSLSASSTGRVAPVTTGTSKIPFYTTKTKTTDCRDAAVGVAVSSGAVSELICTSYGLPWWITHLIQGLLDAAVGYGGWWKREPGREMAQGQTLSGLVQPLHNSIGQMM